MRPDFCSGRKALGEEAVPTIRKAIVLNGRVGKSVPCVCAQAPHRWCAGSVSLQGKTFLTNSLMDIY